MALSEGAKDMVYFRKLVAGLNKTYVDGPSNLATDNMGARDLSYNPEHHDRTKHIDRRHFYVREQVEELELNVPHVPTEENVADIFTKPLKPSRFLYLRGLLMGCPQPAPARNASALVAQLRALLVGSPAPSGRSVPVSEVVP